MADTDGDRRAELMRRAEAFWSASGSRVTTVRRIICECMFEVDGSIDAEGLLRRSRQRDKLISLSTVYRTLASLSEAGLVVEVEGRDGAKSYNVADDAAASSTHIVCEDCGHVTPVENPCLGLREAGAARSAGFRPTRISLRVEAHCETLDRAGACKHRTGDGHRNKKNGSTD